MPLTPAPLRPPCGAVLAGTNGVATCARVARRCIRTRDSQEPVHAHTCKACGRELVLELERAGRVVLVNRFTGCHKDPS